MVNKEEILLDWVRESPLMTDIVLLNWLNDRDGTGAIVPVSEAVAADYCDGTKLVHYDFMLQFMYSVSDTTDTTNTDRMFDMRKWQDWIEQQDENGNLPDFGDGYDMQEVRNLSGMPDLAQVYENGAGKYQFPARLVYLQKWKV